jgi:type IV pilus assembly protein PilC
MAEFVWEARARSGELRKGTMDADSEETVRERLRTMQLSTTKVARNFSLPQIRFGSGVDSKDLVTFTRLFATMIDAGLPIVQCLDILAGQTNNAVFADILRDVKESVEQGSTFSDALRRHPKVFDTLYTNLVAAGELGGMQGAAGRYVARTIANEMGLADRVAQRIRGNRSEQTRLLVDYIDTTATEAPNRGFEANVADLHRLGTGD